MIYIIDILILINIGICIVPDLPPNWTAVLLLTHIALVLIADLMYTHQTDKIEKNENTINEHLEWHRLQDEKEKENE